MKCKRLNILVFGIVSSGSSALVDLLFEYDNINVIPREFDDFRASGLVADQLSYQQSIDFPNKIDILLKNNSIWKLINKMIPVFKWEKHRITWTRSNIRYTFTRLKQLYYLRKLNKKLKLNYSFEEKIQFANDWITDIGNINSRNRKNIVFNQPFEIVIDIDLWKKVFNPFKLLCVYRNPKDQLTDIINRGFISSSYDGPNLTIAGVNIGSIYGRNRKGAIKFHLDAIKKRMEWIDTIKSRLNSDELLLLDFEGLVSNYDTYKKAIENFIGDIEGHHLYKYKYFDPIKSKNNIGIYKKILNEEELELLSDLNSWYNNMIKQDLVSKEIFHNINNLSKKHITNYTNDQIS